MGDLTAVSFYAFIFDVCVLRGNVITGFWTGSPSLCTRVRAAPNTTRLDSWLTNHCCFSCFENLKHLPPPSVSSCPAGDLPLWGTAGPRSRPALHAPVAGSQCTLLWGGDGLSGVLRGGWRPRAGLGDRHPSGADACPEQRWTQQGGPQWVGNSNIHFIPW